MLALREAFGLAVGFSDHTVGSAAAIQAVTLGACMLEKHYTLDHDLPGPDHWFSVNPEELKQYVDDVRAAEQRMGFREVKPAQVELQNRKEFRLSLVAKRDLPAGHCISESDFVVTKPGTGLPPKESAQIIGLALKTDVTRGRPLQWADFR
jgi:sialic acid synthase SpsE